MLINHKRTNPFQSASWYFNTLECNVNQLIIFQWQNYGQTTLLLGMINKKIDRISMSEYENTVLSIFSSHIFGYMHKHRHTEFKIRFKCKLRTRTIFMHSVCAMKWKIKVLFHRKNCYLKMVVKEPSTFLAYLRVAFIYPNALWFCVPINLNILPGGNIFEISRDFLKHASFGQFPSDPQRHAAFRSYRKYS